MIQGVGENLLVLVRRWHDYRVVSEGLRKNKSSRSGKQLEEFVMGGLELRSSMNLW